MKKKKKKKLTLFIFQIEKSPNVFLAIFFLPTIFLFGGQRLHDVVNCTEEYGKCCFPLLNERY